MTDRDTFATAAMAAMIPKWTNLRCADNTDDLAHVSYRIADSMIACRGSRVAAVESVTSKEQDALNLAVRALHRFESSQGLKAAETVVAMLERLGGSYS
jgi:hypothetical protein